MGKMSSGSRRRAGALAAGLLPALLCLAVSGHDGVRPAWAQPSEVCRVIEFEVTPTEDLQMVVWIEDQGGAYVDTLYITRKTGRFGLANRPGIMEFNSGPLWPYGRRTTTFPVWAGRHGHSFPLVVFQDGNDNNLSHALGQSSRERYYCRPVRPDEQLWENLMDAQSCASTVYTDKGLLSPDQTSPYPPRTDIVFDPTRDDPSVESMAGLNPFDAVSRATPSGDEPMVATWAVPPELPNGDYVLWVEVSREFDQNEHHDYPSPNVAWSEYGLPYRGQPSVVYRVEFSLGDELSVTRVLDHSGYGDPDGLDAVLRPPDDTITTGVPGSGASRLLVMTDGEPHRLRVAAYPSPDDIPPAATGEVEIEEVTSTRVAARFRASGDDGLEGEVTGYEVRYLAGGGQLDAASFDLAREAAVQMALVPAGEDQAITIVDLVPRTNYTIGIRPYDECRNVGPITTFQVTTPRVDAGSVDACFVATAAHGSALAGEVGTLRAFRDAALRSHLPGELVVEGYYTFGPLLARVIGPSETLRRAARAALAPAVDQARTAGFR
jgi:hypothetical protein